MNGEDNLSKFERFLQRSLTNRNPFFVKGLQRSGRTLNFGSLQDIVHEFLVSLSCNHDWVIGCPQTLTSGFVLSMFSSVVLLNGLRLCNDGAVATWLHLSLGLEPTTSISNLDTRWSVTSYWLVLFMIHTTI